MPENCSIGNLAEASGEGAIACGAKSLAKGKRALAVGYGASAIGDYATAIGDNTSARGKSAIDTTFIFEPAEVERLREFMGEVLIRNFAVELIATLRTERDSARAIARVLAQAYVTGEWPLQHMVDEALAFPVVPPIGGSDG